MHVKIDPKIPMNQPLVLFILFQLVFNFLITCDRDKTGYIFLFHSFVFVGLPDKEMSAMALGLAHRYAPKSYTENNANSWNVM